MEAILAMGSDGNGGDNPYDEILRRLLIIEVQVEFIKMGLLNITKQDVQRTKPLAAEWFVTEVKNYEETTDKDKASLHKFTGEITEGNSKGYLVEWQFSEKAPGFAIPFLTACGADVGEEGGAFPLEDCIGKVIKVKNEPKIYNNRKINNIVDFMKNV